MKLRKEFISQTSNDETYLVGAGDVSFYGIVRGNKTLNVILELLREDTTEAEIVAAMMRRFDAPEEIIARDVKKALSELERIGAIDG